VAPLVGCPSSGGKTRHQAHLHGDAASYRPALLRGDRSRTIHRGTDHTRFRVLFRAGPSRDATQCAWLDFGPGSVDGWLARLAAAELGVQPEELLDADNRKLVLDDARVPPDSARVRRPPALARAQGEGGESSDADRGGLGHEYVGGNNVVDVVVRS
jgi:hypothetical protein